MGANNEAVFEQQYMIPVELTAAAGVSVTTTPAEQIGSFPFVWEKLGAQWDESKGDWSIRIIDSGADLAFMPKRVKVESLVSTSRRPWQLDHPHTFGAGSAIMVEATNNGTDADTLHLTFIGKRLPQRF